MKTKRKVWKKFASKNAAISFCVKNKIKGLAIVPYGTDVICGNTDNIRDVVISDASIGKAVTFIV